MQLLENKLYQDRPGLFSTGQTTLVHLVSQFIEQLLGHRKPDVSLNQRGFQVFPEILVDFTGSEELCDASEGGVVRLLEGLTPVVVSHKGDYTIALPNPLLERLYSPLKQLFSRVAVA
jgi:hypothetical protein